MNDMGTGAPRSGAPKADKALEVPPAVRDYVELDLSAGSSALLWLEQRAMEEEQDEDALVTLSSDLEQSPAGLTPTMSAWYARFVASRRHGAIEAVRSRFEGDRVKDIPSVLLESELDRVANETVHAKHRAQKEFHAKNAQLRTEAEELARDYEMMLAEQGGRRPRMISPAIYALGLAFVVMLELFLNFESFMAVSFIGSPFLATGITGLVAIAVGAAAHLHGSLLRQWDYYFGPHDKVRRFQGWRMASIGGTLLSVALGAVLGARYYYILPLIEQARMLGSEPPSLVGSLSFMVAGNIIVYLAGVAWAYMTHDEIPDYPSVKRRADAKRAAYDQAFKSQVSDELARLEQKMAVEQKKIRGRARAQESSPNHLANRQLFSLVKQKDEEVCAVLLDHRAKLTRQYPDVRYRYPNREMTTQDLHVEISAGEWAAKDLLLKYHTA